ncbi:MAG: lysine transporter LysE [Rhodobacterales bacterium]|nr:MAG: lysine transporter LysE [Rhodobacterales bacterium]
MSQSFFALILFLFPLAYSPGPGNLFFAANGARFGVRATLPASLGYHLATWIVTAAIGMGFVATLEPFPRLALMLRIAGALYVLWLAWKFYWAGAVKNGGEARPAGVWAGAILLLLNPKAYVIIALMFTQFLGQTRLPHLSEVLWITSIFTLNNLVAFSLWTLLGDRLAALFHNPRHARQFNRLFAAALGLVAVWMLVG